MTDQKPTFGLILGVSASIAIYRACDLTRRLVKSGAEVRVCMTKVATSWINPLIFEALSGHPVITADSAGMPHIELRMNTDLMLVAPASADLLARAAAGMGDDAVTATLLSYAGPRWLAPAMNPAMYSHPATVRNLESLRGFGNTILETKYGEAVCGDLGDGKLADIDFIFDRIAEFAAGIGKPLDYPEKQL